MRFKVFSSGSDGNCSVLITNKLNILIDAGITRKQIEENLHSVGLTVCDINLLFITHEHVDHIRALPQLLKEENLQIFMSKGTFEATRELYKSSKTGKKNYDLLNQVFENKKITLINRIKDNFLYPKLTFETLSVQVLPAFHDAAETIGFTFTEDGKKLVYITDTGYVHQIIYPDISNADMYVLESNHDPEILMHSDRPYSLKIRVLSDHGHMSNEDSMITLCNVMGPATKVVMHAHVSQECNLSEIIVLTREKVFQEFGVAADNVEFVILAPRPSKEYTI